MQLFIGNNRAFDSVDRTKLFSRLHLLSLDGSLIQLLQSWHIDTAYIISHAGAHEAVPVQKGLRQGCKAAPFLWNCMMVIFLHELQLHVPPCWIHQCLSIYADDCHAGGTFRTQDEFHSLLKSFGILIHVLKEFDLHVNPQKSEMLGRL